MFIQRVTFTFASCHSWRVAGWLAEGCKCARALSNTFSHVRMTYCSSCTEYIVQYEYIRWQNLPRQRHSLNIHFRSRTRAIITITAQTHNSERRSIVLHRRMPHTTHSPRVDNRRRQMPRRHITLPHSRNRRQLNATAADAGFRGPNDETELERALSLRCSVLLFQRFSANRIGKISGYTICCHISAMEMDGRRVRGAEPQCGVCGFKFWAHAAHNMVYNR